MQVDGKVFRVVLEKTGGGDGQEEEGGENTGAKGDHCSEYALLQYVGGWPRLAEYHLASFFITNICPLMLCISLVDAVHYEYILLRTFATVDRFTVQLQGWAILASFAVVPPTTMKDSGDWRKS